MSGETLHILLDPCNVNSILEYVDPNPIELDSWILEWTGESRKYYRVLRNDLLWVYPMMKILRDLCIEYSLHYFD